MTKITLRPYDGQDPEVKAFHSKIKAGWSSVVSRIEKYLETNPKIASKYTKPIEIWCYKPNFMGLGGKPAAQCDQQTGGRKFWTQDGHNWYEGTSLNSSKSVQESAPSSLVREFIDSCKHEDGPVVRKGSKRRNSLKRFHYKKKNEKARSPVTENFNPAAFKTEAVLPPSGDGHGFAGTIDSDRTDVTWEKAFKFFTDYVKPIEAHFGDKILPKDIRDFLDSKYGRKVADFINDGQTFPEALKSYSRSFMTSVMLPFLGYRPIQILHFKNPSMTTESRTFLTDLLDDVETLKCVKSAKIWKGRVWITLVGASDPKGYLGDRTTEVSTDGFELNVKPGPGPRSREFEASLREIEKRLPEVLDRINN